MKKALIWHLLLISTVISTVAFFVCCSRILKKRGLYNTYATLTIHAYQIKQTKLPAGLIPSSSQRILVDDSTSIGFRWTQDFSTSNNQQPGSTFGESSDTVIVNVDMSKVIWDDPNATTSGAKAQTSLKLSAGEYQFQMRTGIWSVFYNDIIWSPYSDAVGLYVDHAQYPAIAPKSVWIDVAK